MIYGVCDGGDGGDGRCLEGISSDGRGGKEGCIDDTGTGCIVDTGNGRD